MNPDTDLETLSSSAQREPSIVLKEKLDISLTRGEARLIYAMSKMDRYVTHTEIANLDIGMKKATTSPRQSNNRVQMLRGALRRTNIPVELENTYGCGYRLIKRDPQFRFPWE